MKTLNELVREQILAEGPQIEDATLLERISDALQPKPVSQPLRVCDCAGSLLGPPFNCSGARR